MISDDDLFEFHDYRHKKVRTKTVPYDVKNANPDIGSGEKVELINNQGDNPMIVEDFKEVIIPLLKSINAKEKRKILESLNIISNLDFENLNEDNNRVLAQLFVNLLLQEDNSIFKRIQDEIRTLILEKKYR